MSQTENKTNKTEPIESEMEKASYEFEALPKVIGKKFKVEVVDRKEYGKDVKRYAIEIHPQWTKEVVLSVALQAFYDMFPDKKEGLYAIIGNKQSRRKNKKPYLACSIEIGDGDIFNTVFDNDELRNLIALGYIKRR